MAPATIRRIYVILRAALEQAVKWDWIPAKPAVRSSPPKVRLAKIEPPAATAVGALFKKIEVDVSKPWRPDGVAHRWARWRSRAGLEGVRLHDLRHFMANTMLTADDQAAADLLAELVDGKPAAKVGQELGHGPEGRGEAES